MGQEKISRKALAAILSAALLSFVGILIETSMNVTFPTMIKEFHVTLGTIQWITTAYLLTVALVIVCSAYIKARYKERHIFITSVCFFVIGTIVCGTAGSFVMLLIGRLIQAIGTGLTLPLMFNIILEQAPKAVRGTYMGVGGMILALAPAFGPTFGGVVVYYLGWRWIFWIVLPLMIIALFMGLNTITQVSETTKPQFDWLRLFILAVFFISLTLGFNTVSTLGWFNVRFDLFMVVAIIAVLAFVYTSNRTHRMLVDISVFKIPAFSLSLTAYFIIQLTNIGGSFMLPNYAQLVDHSTSLISGMILLPGSLVAGLMGPYFGHLLDTYGPKKPILTGNTIYTIALVGFALLSLHLSPLMIVILYLVFSFGRSMAFENTLTNAINNVPRQHQADANAVLNTLQQFGGSIGTSIMASFMTSAAGKTEAVRTAAGTQNGFIFLVILAFLNFVLYHYSFKLAK
ncbi:hypothetical protein IV38_GL001385 [Lactobacillus selangorensis]|uniref:Major facilitator superfamily (MFS) profile domain-containing protein n=1 Tax=Lactobacillus selangorensis TaxID=81857 RepID=A0A0R2FV40_9LACO|nr:DHA2 family efflux MFS transporter permease subunit [Lactobacillus selangorensis]KRN28385.1 hypothetical protein IV38_GL001385 [Lactobacillus selangorensis]KRN31886.1 hypothetical protein IV40_GL001172 [Lactobacillus selangorensis]